MNKNLQTLVGAIDTAFCAAVTMVSDLGALVFFTHTRVPIPETMVFAKQNIFLIRETISPVAKTMVSSLTMMRSCPW